MNLPIHLTESMVVPSCPDCGDGIFKPDVVMFGDNVPKGTIAVRGLGYCTGNSAGTGTVLAFWSKEMGPHVLLPPPPRRALPTQRRWQQQE